MLKRRIISEEERAAAEAIASAPAPISDCRPGIRGRCSIPGCPRCDPPADAGGDVKPETDKGGYQ
jgi:hypothetical protein